MTVGTNDAGANKDKDQFFTLGDRFCNSAAKTWGDAEYVSNAATQLLRGVVTSAAAPTECSCKVAAAAAATPAPRALGKDSSAESFQPTLPETMANLQQVLAQYQAGRMHESS